MCNDCGGDYIDGYYVLGICKKNNLDLHKYLTKTATPRLLKAYVKLVEKEYTELIEQITKEKENFSTLEFLFKDRDYFNLLISYKKKLVYETEELRHLRDDQCYQSNDTKGNTKKPL